MLGFGISTQNRKGFFFNCLEAVYKYAPDGSTIVVFDDASTDGTKEEMQQWLTHLQPNGPKVIFQGSDKILGVANAKSKLVQALLAVPDLTDIFLIEDDVYPLVDGWFEHFLLCAWEHKQAHLLYLPTSYKYGKTYLTSDGQYPIEWKQHCSGLVMYFRQELLVQMKGFENRFGRYGYDHNELTSRALIAQMMNPIWYPHCVNAEAFHALLSKDIEAKKLRTKMPSSTRDESPDGERTQKILAQQNKPLYDELMAHYQRAYLNVEKHSEAEKLAHRAHYYFKGEPYACTIQRHIESVQPTE